jgi:peptidoglycan/LPS O-acetylase OafA/YrhL
MVSSTSEARAATRAHFAGLDGLRGLAAFAVVLYHVLLPLHIEAVAREAYLAVDFFFMLSGFVVANAYDRKLEDNLTFMGFVRIRIARLYPLLFLGMAMGAVVSAMKLLTILKMSDAGVLAASVVMAFLLIPFGRLPYATSTPAFPFNTPAWSLCFEFIINFIYAAISKRLNAIVLTIILVICGLWLGNLARTQGSLEAGGALGELAPAFARVSFSFFAGVALYKIFLARGISRIPWGGVASALILSAVLSPPGAVNRMFFDPAIVMVIFPIIIILSIGDEPTGKVRRFASFAGQLSYPLYITHYPIMRVFLYLAEKHQIHGLTLDAMIAVEILVILAAAALALYFYDNPIQALLKRRKLARAAAGHDLAPGPAQ